MAAHPTDPDGTMLKAVNTYEQNLAFLAEKEGRKLLTQIQRGIEKEGLRVDEQGNFAMTPHPRSLGSALTNPWLTTDFSEALLEFITPVFTSIEETLEYLKDTHAYFYKCVAGENIWAASMPCILPEDERIPVAQYGSSNIARMKTIYRIGLGHRYGRAMQTIAGVHYNFSMPEQFWQAEFERAQAVKNTEHKALQDYISQRYLDLIRNFRRNYWLLIYLFGAAPCFHRSFVHGREHHMEALGDEELYLPYATSLRMGDLGYQSTAQKSIFVCYNELNTYIRTLGEAIHKPYPEYEKIGLRSNGKYRQLNTAILQIENEFYSPIRPKRVTKKGETPLRALRERGVEYVEVRCIDVNPFQLLGIDAESMRFMDIFLLYCLIKDSPKCDDTEFQRIAENQSRVVYRGRDPELRIYCGDNEVSMRHCAENILNDMKPVAEQLDQAHQSTGYSDSLAKQLASVLDDSLTPSAKILSTLADNNQSMLAFTLDQSRAFARELQSHRIADSTERQLKDDVETSLAKQQELEQNESVGFDEYLADYYRQ